MAERIGVLLLNLGGPDRPEAIEPFLRNIFTDREIIRLPGGKVGQALIGRLIARARLPSVKKNYAAIGGASPILELTLRQAVALEHALGEMGIAATVAPAMRYWHPFAEETLAHMTDEGIRRIVALTLYPQYSTATTGSSLRELRRVIARDFPGRFDLTVVDRWPTLPGYLDALAGKVGAALERIPAARRNETALLFSAHGLPVEFVRRGDPYVEEVAATVRGVRERLPKAYAWRIGYQSRVGPVRWLHPTTEDVLRALREEGRRDVVIIPVSFVTDHFETLYEIDRLLAGLARTLGFENFVRTEALNDDPAFIRALADLVRAQMRTARWKEYAN